MPETYEQIIEEIENYDPFDYANKHGLSTVEATVRDAERSVMKHLAARVREAVGGDPSEWYVIDRNDEKVRIGDQLVTCVDGKPTNRIYALGENRAVYTEDGKTENATVNTWEKYEPDTREKIIEDTLDKLDQTGMYLTSLVTESVEQAVDRAMKLGADA